MGLFDRKEQSEVLSEKAKSQIQGALSYEQDKDRMYKRSNKTAWTIAGVSFVLMVFAIGSLFALLPLHRVTPMLLGFDRSTGIVEQITVIDEKTLNGNEALDKFFVNQYIQNRESYTYQTIQKTYDLTQLFSSEQVANDFIKEYNQKDSLDNILKKGTAKVQVISITLEKIGGENIATARIKVDYHLENNTGYTKNFLIRLSYEYQPKVELALSSRIENPVGFFVTSYQKVQENL